MFVYTLDMFVCEFCQKEYSTYSSYNLHQKTAKFCLRLRNELDIKEQEEEKVFVSSSSLKRHIINCKNKDICNEMVRLLKENKELSEKVTSLVSLTKELTEKNNSLLQTVKTQETLINFLMPQKWDITKNINKEILY